jgi:type II secretory pathway component PulF
LNLTWKSTNSVIYESIFEDIVTKVSKWEWIVKSMEELDKDHEFFPQDYLQMLSVWEKTASLESISNKINIQYEKEVGYSLARLTKWIEPLAILFAWMFVWWFAFAIFWAILKVTDTI